MKCCLYFFFIFKNKNTDSVKICGYPTLRVKQFDCTIQNLDFDKSSKLLSSSSSLSICKTNKKFVVFLSMGRRPWIVLLDITWRRLSPWQLFVFIYYSVANKQTITKRRILVLLFVVCVWETRDTQEDDVKVSAWGRLEDGRFLHHQYRRKVKHVGTITTKKWNYYYFCVGHVPLWNNPHYTVTRLFFVFFLFLH